MKLEYQVTNLEISKKLREVGVKQESYLSWVKPPQSDWYLMQVDDVRGRTNLLAGGYEVYSAFTVAELGELLPDHISRNNLMFQLHYWQSIFKKHILTYRLSSSTDDLFPIIIDENNDTEANARGKMLIYLKREGLLEKDK